MSISKAFKASGLTAIGNIKKGGVCPYANSCEYIHTKCPSENTRYTNDYKCGLARDKAVYDEYGDKTALDAVKSIYEILETIEIRLSKLEKSNKSKSIQS